MILHATIQDLMIIDLLAKDVIQDMETAKIPQWKEGYPAYIDFLKDFEVKGLYVYKENHQIKGSITILEENELAYKTIDSWQKEKSIVIHRLLVDPKARQQGIAQKLLNHAIKMAEEKSYESIKIDTHIENYKMRKFLEKNGFKKLEYLKIIDRLAYEKVLEDS